jgi:hypothetical protein
MSRYPDLAACGIRYIHLTFHIGGGLEPVESFWESRGLDREHERLLFTGYSRNGKPHTAFLSWARSHEGCCDVWLGLEATRPSKVWPKRPADRYRLTASDLDAFIDLVRGLGVEHGGARARYAFNWDKNLQQILHLPPHAQAVNLALNIVDEKEKIVMTVTYQFRSDEWLVIIEPAGRLAFPGPSGDDVFAQPYETARTLAMTMNQEPPL